MRKFTPFFVLAAVLCLASVGRADFLSVQVQSAGAQPFLAPAPACPVASALAGYNNGFNGLGAYGNGFNGGAFGNSLGTGFNGFGQGFGNGFNGNGARRGFGRSLARTAGRAAGRAAGRTAGRAGARGGRGRR